SRGRTRESAVASDANEALFLRRFLHRAEQEQLIYYVMEAFDQPWKAYMEGAVGSYWGVYDVNRRPKFAFTAPIVRVPEWHVLAEAHEWAEAHWVEYRRRLGAPVFNHGARAPKVSIHVPAYNEPPAMLIETLDALARLDYADFEVLVIDNNTLEEAVWRPVEA